MAIAYLIAWTEVARGIVGAHAGYSLHLSLPDASSFLAQHTAALLPEIPAVFSRPDGPAVGVEVDALLFEKLQAAKSMRFPAGDLAVALSESGHRSAVCPAMLKRKSFMAQCLAKQASPGDVSSFVENWHNGSGENQSLVEYLGMTRQEYAEYVLNPDSLYKALFERMMSAAPAA